MICSDSFSSEISYHREGFNSNGWHLQWLTGLPTCPALDGLVVLLVDGETSASPDLSGQPRPPRGFPRAGDPVSADRGYQALAADAAAAPQGAVPGDVPRRQC